MVGLGKMNFLQLLVKKKLVACPLCKHQRLPAFQLAKPRKLSRRYNRHGFPPDHDSNTLDKCAAHMSRGPTGIVYLADF
jgi:hypothetical protein